MTDFLKMTSGRPTSTLAAATSAGAGDAGKLVKLDGAGRLDLTLMPSGLGPDAKTMVAFEALAARDLVNVNSAGQVRKADASNDRQAHGFVLAAISATASGTVFFENTITGLSGLTPGSRYFLSDSVAGGITLTPVTAGAGKISQEVGVAISATELSFEPQTAYLLG